MITSNPDLTKLFGHNFKHFVQILLNLVYTRSIQYFILDLAYKFRDAARVLTRALRFIISVLSLYVVAYVAYDFRTFTRISLYRV